MSSLLVTELFAALGAAGVAGLAYGGLAYASLWPGSRIFGKALIAPNEPGELALTFDDGPNGAWTPRLLDTLAGYGVNATFFLLGERAQAQPKLVRRMVEAGNVIGNHSWSHPNLARSRSRQIREELKRTSETLEQIAGAPVKFFRPPFGARRPAVYRIARELGLHPVLWNVMTSDWSETSSARITERVVTRIERLRQSGRAANIVLHDGGHRIDGINREPSVTAAGNILAKYKDTCRFVTVAAWAEREMATRKQCRPQSTRPG